MSDGDTSPSANARTTSPAVRPAKPSRYARIYTAPAPVGLVGFECCIELFDEANGPIVDVLTVALRYLATKHPFLPAPERVAAPYPYGGNS